MNEKLLHRLHFILVTIVAWVIGMKKLIEPDMWWYIKTGEWITQNGNAPKEDIFSYTFSGEEWINVKWLYELAVYWFSKFGGPEFTSIFQSLINVLIVFVLYKIFLLISENKNLEIWAIITITTLLICSYRMTARPETISHLFSLLVFYIFLKAKKSNIKLIYFWVLLQLFWVNFHEAYATGIIIMGAFIFGDIIHKKLSKKPLFNWHLLLAFGASILALALNPRGFSMILHPIEIFRQLKDNKFTSELFSWETAYYWTQWESWAFVIILFLGIITLFIGKNKNIISNLKPNVFSFGLGYFFVLILFGYLGFTAYRNIPFLVLMVSPLLAISFMKLGENIRTKSAVAYISCAFSIFAWFAIVSNTFYENTGSRNKFGLEVDPAFSPIGMTEKLSSLDFNQPHFSDYLSSSYALWKIQDYQSFIDLRDLDVFPKIFFEEVISATQSFEVFEEMDKLNQFKYAFVKRSDFPILITGLQQSATWKIEYADPIAILFSKNPDEKHVDIFGDFKSLETSSISNVINLIFYPFYSKIEPDVNLDFMAASFYQSTGDYTLALNRINKVIENPDFKYDALCLRAKVYDNMATLSGDDSLITLEWNDLSQAKKLERKNGKAYFLMGLALYQRGRTGDAVSEFKLSLKYDNQNSEAWSYLADCQNSLSQTDPNNAVKYTNNWFEYMGKALALDPSNSLLAYRLGVSYCERNECDKAQPILEKLGPLPYLRDEDNVTLMRCKKKCNAN
ncbi:MAG: tetratricopeptide repeat protein [Flavobacteriales bacterium]|jgi:tetratricopeptide (TPR) repeat protein|tara:strand:- start:1175 stop:3385 length:2211 start_codon:yes stop_codon:yes gene_type:complete